MSYTRDFFDKKYFLTKTFSRLYNVTLDIFVETSCDLDVSQDIQKLEISSSSVPLRVNVEVIAAAPLLLLWNSYCFNNGGCRIVTVMALD